MVGWRVGVDVGGTFTDAVAFNPSTGEVRVSKALTRPLEPHASVLEAVRLLGLEPQEIEFLVHATTLGTNMLFGQAGLERPRAVLITTKGFRDIIEIGRQNRPELYNLFFRKPEPLVPRSLRFEVKGRLGPRGEVLEELDEPKLREVAERLCSSNTVFVVSFLHCYANPTMELRAAEVVESACPQSLVVTSCSVDPEPGEYERTSTAVVNAILLPVFKKYINLLLSALRSTGFQGRLLVMQSSGGLADPEVVARKPVLFIESGPAAGAVAAAWLARIRGEDLAVGFDMGGTTAKAVLVVEGRPATTDYFEVGGRTHMGRMVRGSGYPVRATHVDLVEVSSGGGTVAWVDKGGALRVGPMSVGADPGPACYGRGGGEPTVVDAHAVLGRLPDRLAGGRIKVRRDLAFEALKRLASELGVDPYDAAAEVLEVANALVARAVRMVTVERGYDPSLALLYAYGGAGPMHAAELALELGAKAVVVPPYPGVFSALGLLVADMRYDAYKALYKRLDELDSEQVEDGFRELEAEAAKALGSREATTVKLVAVRYEGQAESLEVPWRGSLGELAKSFEDLYRARYGYLPPEPRPPLVVSKLHLVAVLGTPKPLLSRRQRSPRASAQQHRRDVYFLGSGWERAEVIEWGSLSPGEVVGGPALVVDETSTVVVPPRWKVLVEDNCVLELRPG